MKAYSYIRFSTPDQMRGDSFRRQTEQARAYADEMGLELQDLTFRDLGVSGFKGKNIKTGALAQFKLGVLEGTIPEDSYLLIEAWDRFSRMTPEEALKEMLELIGLGITVVTLMDNQEYKTGHLDTMKLMLCLMYMSRAHEESHAKSVRIRAAKQAKVDKAREDKTQIISSNCPAWIELQGNTFVLIEDKAAIVRKIIEMTIDGYGKQAIADYFNENNVPTMKTARCWHKTYINAIRNNPACYGQYTPSRGEPIEDYYPAVVDKETWLLANLRVKQRQGTGSNIRSNKIGNYFSGLITCECGSKYRKVDKRKAAQKEAGYPFGLYHVCMGKEEHNGCKTPNLNLPMVNQLLFSALHQAGIEGLEEGATIISRVPKLEQDLADVTSQIGVAIDVLLTRPSEALKERLEQLEHKKESLALEIETTRAEEAKEDDHANSLLLQDIADIVAGDDYEKQVKLTAIIKSLVSNIEVSQRDLLIHFKTGKTTVISRTSDPAPTYQIGSTLILLQKEIFK